MGGNRAAFTLSVLLGIAVIGRESTACGPFFPNIIVEHGESVVLEAPIGGFQAEVMEAVSGISPRFLYVSSSPKGGAHHTAEKDLRELIVALHGGDPHGPVHPPRARTILAYMAFRDSVSEHSRRLQQWRTRGWWQRSKDPPAFPESLVVPNGLPLEFELYARGALAYHRGERDSARECWLRLMDLSEDQRRRRATWAAFMIGTSLLDASPDSVAHWCQTTRDLASQGFPDPLGLAAASLGLEARAALRMGRPVEAIRLYAEGLASGDSSAVQSLRIAATRLIDSGTDSSLKEAAQDSVVARIVSAHLAATLRPYEFRCWESAQRWVAATEASDGPCRASDRLALVAYRCGRADLAQKWLDQGGTETFLGKWLRVKLLLREGRLGEAAGLLDALCRESTPDTRSEWIKESDWATVLYRHRRGAYPDAALGELGVLRLAQGRYAEALDAFLPSRYWLDAAYVADRVFTVDELRAYVDEHVPDNAPATGSLRWVPFVGDVRYTLARRLARLGRWAEAVPYFPVPARQLADRCGQLVLRGEDVTISRRERARSLMAVALTLRTKGIELIGTEFAPDWKVLGGGGYSLGDEPCRKPPADTPSIEVASPHLLGYGARSCSRSLGVAWGIVPPTEDEYARCMRHGPRIQRRWHYVFEAADLAWRAAALMPSNDDETAQMLCTAGTWLKNVDVDAADRFYKALVRRCRQTDLGREADRIRWFPASGCEGAW